jgi:hypothetical protein
MNLPGARLLRRDSSDDSEDRRRSVRVVEADPERSDRRNLAVLELLAVHAGMIAVPSDLTHRPGWPSARDVGGTAASDI